MIKSLNKMPKNVYKKFKQHHKKSLLLRYECIEFEGNYTHKIYFKEGFVLGIFKAINNDSYTAYFTSQDIDILYELKKNLPW